MREGLGRAEGEGGRAWATATLGIGALALAGVGVVLVSTARYGAGVSPDSVAYIAAARSVLSGGGYVTYDGSPFVDWPPLFPTVLAAVGGLGVDPLDAARYVNAIVFGLVIGVGGAWLASRVGSRALAVVGSLAIVLTGSR